MKTVLITLLLSLGLLACTPDQQAAAENGISFTDFHTQFLADAAYQLSHIQFPLEGLSPNPDASLDYHWRRNEWQVHQPLLPESGFSSDFEYISDGFVIEMIIHDNGKYAMERRFAKLSENEWMLIYYAALHPILQ